MAAEKTKADALGIYHTGGNEDGTQRDQALCLGGKIAATEISYRAALIIEAIPNLIVEAVSGANGTGTGTITAKSDTTVAYTAPGGTEGTAVTLADGDTVLLEDTDTDKVVRVRRDGANVLHGQTTFDLLDNYESVIAMSNVSHASRAAGITTYRAVFIKAHGADALTTIELWLDASASDGISIGLETPGADGTIQTIANETTAPAGIAWDSGTSEGAGLSLASLVSGAKHGIWIRRVVSAGATVNSAKAVKLHWSYTASAAKRTQSAQALYRLADTTKVLYEYYESEDGAAIDFTAAAKQTSATLPIVQALTPPGSGTKVFNYGVRYRNEYNLISQNVYARHTEIDNTGAEVVVVPTAPTDSSLTDKGGGEAFLEGNYSPASDASPADKWAIYVTGNGVDPDPATDTPSLATMSKKHSFLRGVWTALQTLGPFGCGADIRVILRSHRSSDSTESTNTNVLTLSIGTTDPAAPVSMETFLGTQFAQSASRTAGGSSTVVYDATNNIRSIATEGRLELWGDTVLIFRINYDSKIPKNNGFFTIFGFRQEAISGAGSGIVETASWTGPSKLLYINVGGTRRMKIDVTNSLIHCAAIRQDPDDIVKTLSSTPIIQMDVWHTMLQVFDINAEDYATACSLDDNGIFALRVGWRQRQTVGEFL